MFAEGCGARARVSNFKLHSLPHLWLHSPPLTLSIRISASGDHSAHL